MSLLADSSPLPKMSTKRLFENGGFNSHHPSNFKHRKLNTVRSFPAKCGVPAQSVIISPKPNDVCNSTHDSPAIACFNSPSNNNIKYSKVDFTRDFPEHCGLSAYKINKGESERPVNGEKHALAIPAVPLRCVPLINVKRDRENLVSSGGKYDDGGKRTAKDNGNKVCLQEESSKHDTEKLAEVEAKNDLNAFVVKYSTSRQILDLEDLSDESTSLGKMEQDESLEKFKTCDSKAVVLYSDINMKTAVKGNNEPKNYDDNQKDLINLSIVKHEKPKGLKVTEVLKLFEEYYKELVKEHEAQPRGERKSTYAHLEAVERLKKEGRYIFPEKPFGHVPGVEIGDEFQFRSQLVVVGLHRQLIAGIDHVVLDGKKYATSVVESGRYKNTAKTLDVLIYSGQGGNSKIADKSVDQKLEKGNLALMNSMEMGYPVRVTYKRKSLVSSSKTLGSNHERGVVYVYDGLYTINNAWRERDQIGKLVFKFELHRMFGQPRFHQIDAKSKKLEMRAEVCTIDDISQGREKIPIRAMNGVDDDRPPPFTYVTDMVYPYWYQQIEPDGCDCVNGCSDSHQCPCVVKNGGEIPYNEKGAIIQRMPRVHECGPTCKCPPTCMNRVGQHGPRFQLEIFKTGKRGWGVRSREVIPSGGFICEYLGEFLRNKEADLRVGDDEYLFDIYNSRGGCVGFAIDAAMYGNVGRFINHSCSPNLYAQDVIYDHGDKRMPHVMFFATKDIPPLQELCYDYNYKLGTVCDANGNVKTKDCYCGSRKCSKRMY